MNIQKNYVFGTIEEVVEELEERFKDSEETIIIPTILTDQHVRNSLKEDEDNWQYFQSLDENGQDELMSDMIDNFCDSMCGVNETVTSDLKFSIEQTITDKKREEVEE